MIKLIFNYFCTIGSKIECTLFIKSPMELKHDKRCCGLGGLNVTNNNNRIIINKNFKNYTTFYIFVIINFSKS